MFMCYFDSFHTKINAIELNYVTDNFRVFLLLFVKPLFPFYMVLKRFSSQMFPKEIYLSGKSNT